MSESTDLPEGARRLFRIIVLALDLFVPRFVTIDLPCKVVNEDGSPGDRGLLRASYFNLFGWPVFVRARFIAGATRDRAKVVFDAMVALLGGVLLGSSIGYGVVLAGRFMLEHIRI